MTREIALHCMKSYSELHSDLCELCPIYGQTGSDHCFEDALQYVIGMLEQEPTTKNDLAVDAISRIETIDYLCKHCPDDGECFEDCDEIKHLRQMPSVKPQLSSELEKNSKKLEKDFGESDCISRQATINAVKRIHPVDTDYDCTLFDKVDVMYVLSDLSSVTPQEPRWIPVSERLPKDKETVLVTFKHQISGKTIGLGSVVVLRGKPHWHVREQNLGTYDVLAWMPLPKPMEVGE